MVLEWLLYNMKKCNCQKHLLRSNFQDLIKKLILILNQMLLRLFIDYPFFKINSLKSIQDELNFCIRLFQLFMTQCKSNLLLPNIQNYIHQNYHYFHHHIILILIQLIHSHTLIYIKNYILPIHMNIVNKYLKHIIYRQYDIKINNYNNHHTILNSYHHILLNQ